MAPANNTSGNAAMMLEEALIRTPYELLRRSHRSAQRQVEKDFLAVQGALNAIAKSLSGDDAESRAQAVTKLDQATERVKGLKRKLEDIQPNQNNPTPLRSRVSYLDHQSKPPKDAPQGGVSTGTEEAGDKTLDRYIVDYLLRTGHMKTATALATKQDIESLVDIKLFAELTKIERALVEKHSVAEALAWCGENRGTLKKTKNNLEFTLRLQDFIELCRKRETTSAIAYSRKYLSAWAPTHMHEIQQGMTLLAFGERTGVTLYKKLYDQERWQSVRHQFRDTFLSLYALPSQSVLSLALSAGLSTLRLPSCVQHVPQAQPPSPTVPLLPAAPPLHNLEDTLSFINSSSTTRHAASPFSDVGGDMSGLIYVNAQGMTACGADGKMDVDLKTHPDARVGNIDCPTCGEDMKVLASEVPMSHHVNSTLVCRISGQIMDSQNPPLSFPNGYVYSTNALKEMAKTNFDVVVCPRTGDSCAFARLRKVYIS